MDLRRWFRRGPSAAEMREEVEAHVAMRAEYDASDAASARKRLGNVLRTEEEMRRVWIAPFWDALAQDARFTWRSWKRSPGFAAAAVLVLALGLGTSTALFSALDRILFRDLPYPQPDRLVSVGLMAPLDSSEFLLGSDYFQLWRETPPPFEEVTTITAGRAACDVTEGTPERLGCHAVEPNLLRVLGLRVIAGRDLTAADDAPNAPKVALIRYELWKRRFGGDPGAVGRTLSLDGQPVPVVGVLPPDFELPNLSSSEVLLPQGRGPNSFLRGYARLKPGVTIEQARAALDPLYQRMRENVPGRFRNEVSLRIRPLRDLQMGGIQRQGWLLFGATGVLLLIACVNVTNLLLARLAAREQEFALRVALGAGKLRLARLALTESTLLALAGGGLGLLLASVLLKVFVAMAPGGIPKLEQASLDTRVLAFSFLAALVIGSLIGLWPAFSVMRSSVMHGARTIAARPRLRFSLVSAQIALTAAMLGSAGLLLRSLWNLAGVPLGFDTERIVTTQITLNAARYRTPEQQVGFFEQVLEASRRIPGVQSAAVSDSLPPRGPQAAMIFSNIDVEGRPREREGTGGMVGWRLVTPGYFDTLRISVLRGRGFTEADRHAPEPAMILTESFERMLFRGEDSLGKRVRPGAGDQPWHVVVGIAKDVRDGGATAVSEPQYYVVRRTTSADARRSSFLTVRTAAGPATAVTYLRQAIADVDPQLPVRFETMEERISSLSNRQRFVAWLVVLFAAFALALAVMGIFGTASYLVTQRAREIGVRMALGASPGDVARQVLRESAAWTAAGAAGGILLARASSQALRSQLFGVTVADPATWIASLLVLAVAVAIAVLRPALRASRVDPAVTLRAE